MTRIAKPIPHHIFHTQSDAALVWLIKDAREAAAAMRDLNNEVAEAKYLDQINDACTVLGYRAALQFKAEAA